MERRHLAMPPLLKSPLAWYQPLAVRLNSFKTKIRRDFSSPYIGHGPSLRYQHLLCELFTCHSADVTEVAGSLGASSSSSSHSLSSAAVTEGTLGGSSRASSSARVP